MWELLSDFSTNVAFLAQTQEPPTTRQATQPKVTHKTFSAYFSFPCLTTTTTTASLLETINEMLSRLSATKTLRVAFAKRSNTLCGTRQMTAGLEIRKVTNESWVLVVLDGAREAAWFFFILMPDSDCGNRMTNLWWEGAKEQRISSSFFHILNVVSCWAYHIFKYSWWEHWTVKRRLNWKLRELRFGPLFWYQALKVLPRDQSPDLLG